MPRVPAATIDLLRNCATAAGRPGLQLVREFIQDSLYHPTEGYFTRQAETAVVGSPPAPLNFQALSGRTAYLQVELFQPHFGAAVAHNIWRQHTFQGRAGEPLHIYELGAGTGTLARDILDWLRHYKPEAYANTSYTSVEISPQLARLQQEKLAGPPAYVAGQLGGPARLVGGHTERFIVRQHNAADAAAWAAHDVRHAGSDQRQQGQHCYIVACEVLDNLPHDRVWREGPGQPWQQTMVQMPPWGLQDGTADSSASTGSPGRDGWPLGHSTTSAPVDWIPSEVLAPANDPLIERCLGCLEAADASAAGNMAAISSSPGGRGGLLGWLAAGLQRAFLAPAGETVWLPTGCLRLLDTLHQACPSHTLVVADFDALPEVQIDGRNAPLVATTTGGKTVDHATYLVPRGMADIFFPTDFNLLQHLYVSSARHTYASTSSRSGLWEQETVAGHPLPGVSVLHMSTRHFMEQYADLPATTTLSGYNPLLEDYSNTAFFLASRHPE